MNKNEKKNLRWGTGKKSCFRPQVQLKNFQFTGGIEKEKVKEEWMKERKKLKLGGGSAGNHANLGNVKQLVIAKFLLRATWLIFLLQDISYYRDLNGWHLIRWFGQRLCWFFRLTVGDKDQTPVAHVVLLALELFHDLLGVPHVGHLLLETVTIFWKDTNCVTRWGHLGEIFDSPLDCLGMEG